MEWQALFNATLIRELELQNNPSSRLREALLYAARSPGKRLRPKFVRESGQRFGLPDSTIDLCGIAIESVHLFSLIHDDLPALDDDDLRRGLPTLHKKFDEGTALLAGDELLNLAYSFFLKIKNGVSSENLLTALHYFSKCIGGEGMIGGQMLELELLHSGTTPDLPTLLKIQDMKTGALFRASILIPALIAGESESSGIFQTLESYANSFGFAFQIADDLEDEYQDEEEARKNILSLMGRDAAIRMAVDGLELQKIAGEFTPTGFLLSKLQSKI